MKTISAAVAALKSRTSRATALTADRVDAAHAVQRAVGFHGVALNDAQVSTAAQTLVLDRGDLAGAYITRQDLQLIVDGFVPAANGFGASFAW